MSLINDALRRANSDKSRGPQSAAPVPPMQPVDPTPASPRILPWALLVSGVGVLAIAAAIWFRPQSTTETARNEAIPSTPSTISAPAVQPTASAVPAPAPSEDSGAPPLPAPVTSAATVTKTEPPISQTPQTIAATVPAPAPVPTITSVQPPPAITASIPKPEPAADPAPREPAETEVAAATPTTTETTTAAPEPRQPQALRLQAIYYRFKKPTVVINGKTLAPGESVDGIKVVSIQRSSVEVVQNGKYRTLTLQD